MSAPDKIDGWIPVELRAIRDLTPTVREFQLAYPTRQAADPGAHLEVRIPIGPSFERRAYSVVGTTHTGDLLIAVKRVDGSRGGSRHLWTLRPGQRMLATAPVSRFELGRHAAHRLLLAGGIGVTALVSMARALARSGSPVRMVYAASSRDELAYAQELTGLLGERVTFFAGDEGRRLNLAREISSIPADGELCMCGPLRLMEAVRAEWQQQGRSAARLRFETFGSGGHHAAQAFTVRIPRLNLEVHVGADRSMLNALSDAGVAVLSECKKGECGLCAVEVLAVDAVVDHRDVFFGAEEKQLNRRICTCVSRAIGGCITIEPAWRGDPDLSATEILSSAIKPPAHPCAPPPS